MDGVFEEYLGLKVVTQVREDVKERASSLEGSLMILANPAIPQGQTDYAYHKDNICPLNRDYQSIHGASFVGAGRSEGTIRNAMLRRTPTSGPYFFGENESAKQMQGPSPMVPN